MFARFITGRRTKWLVIAAWVAAVAAVGAFGLPGKFQEAQTNEPTSFLPGDTESVRALEAVRRLPGGEGNPAIVVAARDGGLTAADKAALRRFARGLRDDPPGPVRTVAPPRYAPGGDAALISAVLPVTGESQRVVDTVGALRDRVDALARERGLDAAVTGPAGFAADAVDAFSGINGTLLTVTALLVLVLLVLVYRSPIFWMVPLAAVGAAELCSRGVGYGATQIGLTVNGQSAGILLVLVFGAGTDYALLLVARYREELGRHDDAHEAARRALSRAAPAIAASAGTVVAALLVLLLARVNSTSGLGPIGALGVVLALVSALTLLPALLAATGRRAFWPLIPRVQGEGEDDAMRRGLWRRLGERLARRPRAVWTGGALILAILCTGVTSLDVGLPQDEQFRDRTEAVRGQDLIARAFPAGALAPATIVVGPGDAVEPVRSLLRDRPGIASLGDEVRRGPSGAVFDTVLKPDPYSAQAFTLVEKLRDALDRAGMRDTLIGGQTATERDYRAAALRDDLVLPPLVLGVVFVILAVVLRALVLPIALIVSVILSYGAAFGVGTFMFAHVFGFAGLEPSLVLLSFIFLVGLGVDYNIFLMTRAREEVARHGQREGMLRSLAVTGTVITSAGIVLAGTFATLAVLPLVALTEIGFLVSFGVLLDALIVRSVILPAFAIDAGPRLWWPSRLRHNARRLAEHERR